MEEFIRVSGEPTIPFAEPSGYMITATLEGDEMSTDAAREFQVPAQCQELTDALEKLAGVMGLLEDRLVRVLQQEAPNPQEGQMATETQVCLVPLADELASFCRKVAHITRNVDSVISRLQV